MVFRGGGGQIEPPPPSPTVFWFSSTPAGKGLTQMDGFQNLSSRKINSRAHDLKIREIQLGSKLLLDLIYGWSFRIQAASYFPQSLAKKTGLIFY